MAAGAKRRATVTRCESTDDTRSNKFVFSRILLPRPLHTPCSCSRGVCAAKRVPMTRPVQRPTGAAPLANKDQMHTQAPCKNGMRPPRASLRVQVFNAGRRLNVYRMQPARGAGGSYLGAGMQRTQPWPAPHFHHTATHMHGRVGYGPLGGGVPGRRRTCRLARWIECRRGISDNPAVPARTPHTGRGACTA